MMNVVFYYHGKGITESRQYKKNIEIYQVCSKFCENNKIDMKSVLFVTNGRALDSTNFNKPISDFISLENMDNLAILVLENSKLSNQYNKLITGNEQNNNNQAFILKKYINF